MNGKLTDFFSVFVLAALVLAAAVLVRFAPARPTAEESAKAGLSAEEAEQNEEQKTAPPEPEGAESIAELNVEIMLDGEGRARVSETYTVEFTGGVFSCFERRYAPDGFYRGDWAAAMGDEAFSMLEAPDGSRPEGCADVYESDQGAIAELYHRSADEKRRFTIEYTAHDTVTLYDDAAEFCWTLKSAQELTALPLITATVIFPEPEGAPLYAAEYNAWLHTPMGGAVSIEDGYAEFSMSDVEQNAGADIRIMLPTRIFPDASVAEPGVAAERIVAEEMRR